LRCGIENAHNSTKLQKYKVTELQSYNLVFRVFDDFVGMEGNNEKWVGGVEEKEGSRRSNC